MKVKVTLTDVNLRRGSYYFWIPIVVPIIGAILGAVTYLFFIEQPKSSCLGQSSDPTDVVTSNGASEQDIELESKTAA